MTNTCPHTIGAFGVPTYILHTPCSTQQAEATTCGRSTLAPVEVEFGEEKFDEEGEIEELSISSTIGLPFWFRKEDGSLTQQIERLLRMIKEHQMMLDALLSTKAACAEAEPHVVGTGAAAPVACNDFDMTEEDYAHLGLD